MTRRVLVIDDSEISLAVARHVLAQAGFAVRVTSTHAEFDAALAEWDPDVVVMDVQMPEGNGIELCREIKSVFLIYVVLVSSLPESELAALRRDCGADGCVSKSNLGALPRAINQALEHESQEVPPVSESVGWKILLVDDSELAAEMGAALLHDAGFDVRTATTLLECEELLRTWAPQIVLADVQMPDIDGGTLCRQIKTGRGTESTRVVLFSTLPTDELDALARRCGADAAVSKLDGFDEMLRQVRELCETTLW